MALRDREIIGYIRLNGFLQDYCNIPKSKRNEQKARGRGDKNAEADFSREEYKQIDKGLVRFIKDLEKLRKII
jgi:hypothetical protein